MSPRALSRLARVALVGAAALPLCAYDAPAPTGPSPLRYRDSVFTAVTKTTITYTTSTGADGNPQPLAMDVYKPVGDTAALRPVMIWVHGGSFAVGSRTDGDVATLAQRFARRGYVTASIDYRLLANGANCSGANTPPACLSAALGASSDAKKSVQWFRRYASALKVDPTRISMGGTSAGAIASVLVAAAPSAGSATEPSSTINTAFSISGGSPTNIIFNAGDSPIYFWHGTADTVVPISWARSNLATMQAKGIEGQIHEIAGAGHVPFAQYGDDMGTQATNWVYAHMNLSAAPQGGFPGAP